MLYCVCMHEKNIQPSRFPRFFCFQCLGNTPNDTLRDQLLHSIEKWTQIESMYLLLRMGIFQPVMRPPVGNDDLFKAFWVFQVGGATTN